MKIKKVITATGNENLSNVLKQNNINILCPDIQYKEGVLEYLEKNIKIDYIDLNEELDGIISIEELIKEIRKINENIKILIISSKTYNEEKIIKIINHNLKEPKEKVEEKSNNIINNKKINYRNSIFNQKTLPINNFFYFNNKNTQENKEIICILGPNGIGKSVFSILFAQSMKNKKSVIIDFDILNKSLHTLLGVKNYEEKIRKSISKNDLINNTQSFEKYIIKNNTKIDLLSGMNLILDSKYKLSYKKMKNIIEQLKEKYDVIIFDTSAESFLDYTREIINLSNQVIFISGANLLEVKKSEKLLEIYNKEWGIKKSKINIVFNKCTNKSIDETVLKEIFNKYNILGKIQLNDYYDLLINKKMTQKSKLQKEIEKIKKQIIKEKYYGVN